MLMASGLPYDVTLPPYLTDGYITRVLTEAMKLKEDVKVVSKNRIDKIGTGYYSVIFEMGVEISGRIEQIIAKFPLIKRCDLETNHKRVEQLSKLHNTELNAYLLLQGSGVLMPQFLGGLPQTGLDSGVIVTRRFPWPVATPDFGGLTLRLTKDLLIVLARLHFEGFCMDKSTTEFGPVDIKVKLAHFLRKFPKTVKIWTQDLGYQMPIKMGELEFLLTPETWHNLVENCEHPTLIHGDLWYNNILVSTEGVRKGRLAALIDWQETYFGSIGEDISRLLTQNCSHALVRDNFDSLIDLYFDELSRHFSERHSKPPFGKKYVIQEVEKFYGYGSIFAFFEATAWRDKIADHPELPELDKRVVYNLRKSVEFLKKHGIMGTE